jgi:hypothetical protein
MFTDTLASGFVRVNSCEFVDRTFSADKRRSTKSHEPTRTKTYCHRLGQFLAVSGISLFVHSLTAKIFGPLEKRR